MLEKLAEAVDQTSQLGEKVISTLIDRHLDRAALSINIKGVLSTVAYLIGVVVRMLALALVAANEDDDGGGTPLERAVAHTDDERKASARSLRVSESE